MSDYHKQKALQATNNRIESNLKQSNFFIRNKWTVIGFGIFVSAWAPTQVPVSYGVRRKSAMELSNLSYNELVIVTAVLYTLTCVLGHFIWKWQDKQALNKLLKKKKELEAELGIPTKN
ncbi:hypothetical protein [Aequorivita sp. Q41]|uniref:hypothetical protein n=1 Tax=Aequorivita sp. Q41 TaxID=3153300 RepID=UPI003242C630